MCANMGGMRRSHATNTLVLISDYTKGLYHDKWIGGVLHYTGMGKNGDQDIHWAQNETLANCKNNGVDVHLFEVMETGKYIYCGQIMMVGKPYTETQPGDDGIDRLVWMFPIKPLTENDIKKPALFVFKDLDEYRTRGLYVDAEYNQRLAKKGKKSSRKTAIQSSQKASSKPAVVKTNKKGSKTIAGHKIRHKVFGEGTVVDIKNGFLYVTFPKVGKKQLNYQVCLDKGLIEFL